MGIADCYTLDSTYWTLALYGQLKPTQSL